MGFISELKKFAVRAFAVILAIKGMNSLQKKEEEKTAEPPNYGFWRYYSPKSVIA